MRQQLPQRIATQLRRLLNARCHRPFCSAHIRGRVSVRYVGRHFSNDTALWRCSGDCWTRLLGVRNGCPVRRGRSETRLVPCRHFVEDAMAVRFNVWTVV